MAVYTVTDLTTYVRELLELNPTLQELWVSGEVSNVARPSSGHVYFTLKDSESQLRCAMFRAGRRADRLVDGAQVLAHGHLSLYQARGDLQLYADLVQPQGMGERYLELEALKLKLENEGLFDPARKRPLPRFPKRIAVVTSPSGAVWHDICSIIERRYPLAELVQVPTPVQGTEAVPGILEAFHLLDQEDDIDLVILARGGGSLEELWAFNEDSVARAIFGSNVPVISAVGHETDYTIADMVADLRAPTPSAAAEMAVPNQLQLLRDISDFQQRVSDEVLQMIATQQQGLALRTQRLNQRAPAVDTFRQRIDELSQLSHRYLKSLLALQKERTEGLEMRLGTLEPRSVLQRGYALVVRADTGGVVSRVAQVSARDGINVTVSDGSFDASVSDLPSTTDDGGRPRSLSG